MKKRKAAVIGCGHVGAHTASALVTQGIVDELVLLDINQQKADSEVQDLNDSLAFLPDFVDIHTGSWDDLADTDIIIHAVGDIELLRDNHDRTLELSFNAKQASETGPKIRESGFDGVLINISNPCDVITSLMAQKTGLPEGRVLGTGTGLDSSRLISALSQYTGLSRQSITGCMLGEHGNMQFCPWSTVSFHGLPLTQAREMDPKFCFDEESMTEAAIQGGWTTFAGKQCTEYGIAAAAARIAHAVLNDEKIIIPVSTALHGAYGQEDVFAGVPCVIGKNGAEKVIELPLTPSEAAQMAACCNQIRSNMKKAADLCLQTES